MAKHKWTLCEKKQPPNPYYTYRDEKGQSWFCSSKDYYVTIEPEAGVRKVIKAVYESNGGPYWWYKNSLNEIHPIAWMEIPPTPEPYMGDITGN